MDRNEKDQELCDVLEIKFSEVICNFLEVSRETLKDDFAIISTALLSCYARFLGAMEFNKEEVDNIMKGNRDFVVMFFDELKRAEGKNV